MLRRKDGRAAGQGILEKTGGAICEPVSRQVKPERRGVGREGGTSGRGNSQSRGGTKQSSRGRKGLPRCFGG